MPVILPLTVFLLESSFLRSSVVLTISTLTLPVYSGSLVIEALAWAVPEASSTVICLLKSKKVSLYPAGGVP